MTSLTRMQIVKIPSGALAGFKALGAGEAEAVSIEASKGNAAQDWSAVYPQLSFEMALNYLPNQFDRGHKIVQIVKLYNIKPISLLIHADPLLTIPSLDSKTKADSVRASYTQSGFGTLNPSLPLMQAVGEVDQCLCVLDSDDFELVIPNKLFSKEHFQARVLFTFHENPRLPGVVGSVEGFEHLARWQLEDLKTLNGCLQDSLESVVCTSVIDLIKQALEPQQ